MSDPSGKMLSGLTPCSEKPNSKLGGCAGVFFQLFDWNRRLNGKRLLSRKLLPAERPTKHASKHHMDEKLPIAKMFLIADENRGGFPRALSNEAGDILMKEKTPEKKKSKRGPGVVAKLMGLETMPSPEPPKDSKQGKGNPHKHEENCDPKALSFRAKSAVDDNRICVQHSAAPHSCPRMNSLHVSSSHDASITCDSLHVKPIRTLVPLKSDDPKISFFCKLPALSPRKAEGAFRSILSPSKSHNKLLSPIKSPLSGKRAARLLEAATKILEPSMQPSIRARGVAINSQITRSLLSREASHEDQKCADMTSRPAPLGPKKKPSLASDAKKQQQSVALRVFADPPKAQPKAKQDKKPTSMLDSTAACKSQASISNRRVPSHQESLKRSGSTREESVCHGSSSAGQQRLIRSKSVKDEPEQGKANYFYQNVARFGNKEDKGKVESRKQQQNCNRTSQPGACLKKRGSNLMTMDEYPADVENQNPNVMVLLNHVDTRQSISTDSVATSSSSSGILNYSRLFGSRKAATSDDSSKKTDKKRDSSVMKSFLRKKVDVSDNTTKSGSKAVLKDSSQVSKSGKAKSSEKLLASDSGTDSNSLILSGVTQEIFVNNNDPSSCKTVGAAFAASLDSRGADLEISDISCKTSTARYYAKKQECASDSNEVVSSLSTCATSVHSNVGALQLPIQSGCESSTGELSDSVSSSYACLEFSKHRKKKLVSYSGKTTAAILQELLMALNSAKTQVARDESMQNMSDSGECVSSSKFTLCAQLGDDCDDSASSATVMSNDLRTIPMAMRRYNSRAECSDEWRHPSPVSTLDFPSEDSSSALSDNFEDAQERKLLSRVLPKNHHNFVSRRHHIDFPFVEVESKVYKEASECEEQYVKDVVRTAKLSPSDIYAAKLQLPSCTLLDPAVFTNLEEQYYQQWEWGITPNNMYGKCRSDVDTRFTRSLYVEAGVQNRKLVFECINEALNMQLGINEHRSRQSFSQSAHSSSERHISQSVCRQMEAWRRVGCCMNIDDLVDQEMNTGFGRWVDFSDEVSDFAVEMEGNIVQGLIDELVKDLGSRRMPRRQSSRKERSRVSCDHRAICI